jgi:putative spermidine/putrescine transport system ATP-binding protein
VAEVEFWEVSKQYRDVEAVRSLNLRIAEGEFFALLGPSGCGKTTTLRMVAGFIRPTSGAIYIQGQDVTALPPERRNVGIVFQNYAIFPHMNVYDNIAFGLRMRGVPPAEVSRRLTEALEQVGLLGYERRYQRELSGGEQQRVALARALVTHPRILLLDEPLSALDKKLREEMKYWIKDLQQRLGITTIYVTHDQSEALTMADRLAVMNRGVVEQVGAPREIYEHPRTRFVTEFIGESNLLPARVTTVGAGEGAGEVLVQLERIQVAAPARDGVRPGQAISLVVRPENVLLGPEAVSAVRNRIKAQLLSETYQGPMIRYTLRVSQHTVMVAVAPNLRGRQLGQVGETIDVGWDPASSTVLMD